MRRPKKQWANWLETSVGVITTITALPTTAQFQADLDQFSDVITLRNCISHTWGNIAKGKYPKQVSEAVQRIAVIQQSQNCEFAYISNDDYLVLGKLFHPWHTTLASSLPTSAMNS